MRKNKTIAFILSMAILIWASMYFGSELTKRAVFSIEDVMLYWVLKSCEQRNGTKEMTYVDENYMTVTCNDGTTLNTKDFLDGKYSEEYMKSISSSNGMDWTALLVFGDPDYFARKEDDGRP